MNNNVEKEYLELTYNGGLKIEKLRVKISSIISIQKPCKEGIGCIIQLMGEKYPVKETYEEVWERLNLK